MPVETMRVSVRVRLCVVMEGAQLVPLAQSRGPFSPSLSTWRLSWAGLCCNAIVPSRPRPCVWSRVPAHGLPQLAKRGVFREKGTTPLPSCEVIHLEGCHLVCGWAMVPRTCTSSHTSGT